MLSKALSNCGELESQFCEVLAVCPQEAESQLKQSRSSILGRACCSPLSLRQQPQVMEERTWLSKEALESTLLQKSLGKDPCTQVLLSLWELETQLFMPCQHPEQSDFRLALTPPGQSLQRLLYKSTFCHLTSSTERNWGESSQPCRGHSIQQTARTNA